LRPMDHGGSGRTFESDPIHSERTPMNDFIVETHSLTKRFGSRIAVDGVDLRIPRGSAFGYLGPNGAGKTTLIRMLLGLTSASSGTMQLRGLPVPARRAEALSGVGAIVEEPRFHPFLTGRENLEIIAAAREPEAHARIDGALERVGLAARADERVKKYSLGMRQRLGVARALLGDPELLILDEPTNGLDPAGILEFRGLVRRLVAEGRTVVLSSHLLDEVEKICDAVAIVDRGRVVWQGSIDAIHDGTSTVLVAVDDEPAALALLDRHEVEVTSDGLLVRLSAEARSDVVAELNRLLVTGGIGVHRLELSRASLEERFLEITSRLEEAA
jgi:ABC-2 type transport system ATP-binding protein